MKKTKILSALIAGITMVSFIFDGTLLEHILPVSATTPALTYHVGAYDMFPESDGNISVTIDGKKYYYSEDFDPEDIGTKLPKMENQNVVYELHDNEIVKVYTMDQVLSPEVTVEPDIKDGLIYRNKKFSQSSFELTVKVSNNLQGDFQKNDLLWFLSNSEKERLYTTLKKLEIEPSNEVDFGSSGWWMWKEYQKNISENKNDIIKVGETREYKYTVNLHNDKVLNQSKYNLDLYVTPTFDTGVGLRAEAKIPVGNLDYQEEKVEEKKAASNSAQATAQAAIKLNGIKNAIQFSNGYFSADQTKQINDFVNMWMSELILAKSIDKSDLKEKVTKDVADKWLKKLGLDSNIITITGQIQATTYLETQTKDGTKVFIKFDINMLDFDFGSTGMPTMASGSGTATVYNMNGEKIDSSAILPAYADVCAFCEQLQKVAKSQIFSGAKEVLKIFDWSSDKTAEALSSEIMTKVLNNKYAQNIFKKVDAKDVKKVLEKIISKGESTCNDKIFKLITTPSKSSTEINIKCPVDVKIYDNDGKLCGEVKDNAVIFANDDIFVNVVGDQKNIYIIGDGYSFEMTGTDKGTMDYVVREFDEDGNVTKLISYEKVKLTDGCKYYSYAPEAVNLDSVLFDLTDNKGHIISPTPTFTVDNLTYRITGDHEVDIYKCDKAVTSVNIPELISYNGYSFRVTRISDYAFSGCKSLTSITIPNNVTEICYGTFSGCENLSNITIPNGVNTIYPYTFKDCKNLNSVTIPNSVTNIKEYAFEGCSNLTEITMPDSVTSVGNNHDMEIKNPFYNCPIKKLIIADGSKKITMIMTLGLENINEVIIPDSVTSIEQLAFSYCSSLTSITIPEGVTSIGYNAFSDCSSLTNINIPNTVTSIGSNAFSGTALLENKTGIKYVDKWVVDCDKDVETAVINDGTKGIADAVFSECSNLTSILIPDSVTSIGDSAFSGCLNLVSITMSNSVASIGNSAFWGCLNLVSITIPNSVASIGNSAFSGCSSLTSITIPEGVTNIGDDAFWRCSSLIDVNVSKNNIDYCDIDGVLFNKNKTILIYYPNGKSNSIYFIPNSVTSIGEDAFYDCSLKSITIPNGVTSIGEAAFYGCSLKSITIPNSVNSIGDFAFGDCIFLESIQIPNSVTSIGYMIFYDCSSLKNITIPDSITSIGDRMFEGCQYLESITLPKNITSIGVEAFRYCSSLTSITIPEGVTSIGYNAFTDCKSLTNVIIPDSVISVDEWAFSWCTNLESIAIPSSTACIGEYAFAYCQKLTSIAIKNPNCKINDSSYTINDTATIYGYENSTAQAYAEKYNRKFVSLGTAPEFMVSDIVKLKKWLVKSGELDNEDFAKYDLYNDGSLNVFDLVLMKRRILNT